MEYLETLSLKYFGRDAVRDMARVIKGIRAAAVQQLRRTARATLAAPTESESSGLLSGSRAHLEPAVFAYFRKGGAEGDFQGVEGAGERLGGRSSKEA